MEKTGADVEGIARELMDLRGTGRQVAPFSRRPGGLGLDAAYAVVNRIRALRTAGGEMPTGRKIGFTNRAVWADHGIDSPIWNHVFDSTVRDIAALPGGSYPLDGLTEPRIEPELVLHLRSAPLAGMDEDALADCVDWVAPAFEIVHSPFPGWDFAAADAAAAFGVHAALLVGERAPLPTGSGGRAPLVSDFAVRLSRGDGAVVEGHASSVLGGPLRALAFLLADLETRPECPKLAAGEIVTTGTLTEAMPARPGDAWTATFGHAALRPVHAVFA